METIVLAGGCFWCLDSSFKLINGIDEVLVGYAGGSAEDADYYKVGSGRTGHAEAVQVTFDTSKLSLSQVLEFFWAMHDPTTRDRQGNDTGPQYRSAIFYANDTQRQTAEQSIAETQKLWDNPIVTELSPLDSFYTAEEYHQDYFKKNPGNAYCQIIINPKLDRIRQKFADHIIT